VRFGLLEKFGAAQVANRCSERWVSGKRSHDNGSFRQDARFSVVSCR
jgi:hypothetical protein